MTDKMEVGKKYRGNLTHAICVVLDVIKGAAIVEYSDGRIVAVGPTAFKYWEEVPPEPVVTEKFLAIIEDGSRTHDTLTMVKTYPLRQGIIKKTYHDGVFVKLEVIE